MSCCKNKSGQSLLLGLVPVVASSSSTSSTFYVDLEHFLCRNRNICVTAQYPLSGTMQVSVASVENIGTNLYSLTIQLVGTVSYMPYVCGCQCDICPVTDTVFTSITVPFSSTTTPNVTITQPSVVLVSPTNVKDCCTKTNAVEIEFAFTVANATTDTTTQVLSSKSK